MNVNINERKKEIKKLIDEYINLNNSIVFNHDLLKKHTSLKNRLNKIQKEINEKYNKFFSIFLISLNVILCFFLIYPGVVFYKKAFKIFKENRDKKLREYWDIHTDLIRNQNKIIDSISFEKLLNGVFLFLDLDHNSNVSSEFLNQIPLNDFLNSKKKNQKNYRFNTFNSSWSIYKKNKIIINLAIREMYLEKKTYEGTNKTNYVYVSHKSRQSGKEEITASITKYVPVFKTNYQSIVFTKNQPNLDFQIRDVFERNFFGKLKTKPTKLDLSNEKFNTFFDVRFTDINQLRKFVDFEAQKAYVDIVEKSNFTLNNSFKVIKNKNFIFSKYNEINLNINPDKIDYISEFKNKFYSDLKILENKLRETFYNLACQKIDNLAFIELFNCLIKEDNSSLIKEINSYEEPRLNNWQLNRIIANFDSFYINSKLISDCFNEINKHEVRFHKSYTINELEVNTIYYEKEKKQEVLSTYSVKADETVNVGVDYYDYKEINHKRFVYIIPFKTDVKINYNNSNLHTNLNEFNFKDFRNINKIFESLILKKNLIYISTNKKLTVDDINKVLTFLKTLNKEK